MHCLLETNRERIVAHIVLNVPHITVKNYMQYFQWPKEETVSVNDLRDHARKILKVAELDLIELYRTIAKNGELKEALSR